MSSSSGGGIAGNLVASSSAFNRKVCIGIRRDSEFFLRSGDDCYATVSIEVTHQDIRAHCHSVDWHISNQRPQVEKDRRLKLIEGRGERRYKQAKVFVAQARHCRATAAIAAPGDNVKAMCSWRNKRGNSIWSRPTAESREGTVIVMFHSGTSENRYSGCIDGQQNLAR